VSKPWEVAPQGYISVAPQDDEGNWSQIYGQEKSHLPAWASRLPRIHEDLATRGGRPS
jgi:hypothetical protein